MGRWRRGSTGGGKMTSRTCAPPGGGRRVAAAATRAPRVRRRGGGASSVTLRRLPFAGGVLGSGRGGRVRGFASPPPTPRGRSTARSGNSTATSGCRKGGCAASACCDGSKPCGSNQRVSPAAPSSAAYIQHIGRVVTLQRRLLLVAPSVSGCLIVEWLLPWKESVRTATNGAAALRRMPHIWARMSPLVDSAVSSLLVSAPFAVVVPSRTTGFVAAVITPLQFVIC